MYIIYASFDSFQENMTGPTKPFKRVTSTNTNTVTPAVLLKAASSTAE